MLNLSYLAFFLPQYLHHSSHITHTVMAIKAVCFKHTLLIKRQL